MGEYDANRRLDIRDIRKITKDLILVNNEVSTKFGGVAQLGEHLLASRGSGVRFSSSPPIQTISRTFRIFLSLAYRCTRRRRRKSELHANLFEFKINIKDCTLKTKQCNKR